jgi:hypothetical protein
VVMSPAVRTFGMYDTHSSRLLMWLYAHTHTHTYTHIQSTPLPSGWYL